MAQVFDEHEAVSPSHRSFSPPSRAQFEHALNRFDGAVLAVVHDRFFIRLIADKIWWVENGGIRQVWEVPEGNANPRDVDRSVNLAG